MRFALWPRERKVIEKEKTPALSSNQNQWLLITFDFDGWTDNYLEKTTGWRQGNYNSKKSASQSFTSPEIVRVCESPRSGQSLEMTGTRTQAHARNSDLAVSISCSFYVTAKSVS